MKSTVLLVWAPAGRRAGGRGPARRGARQHVSSVASACAREGAAGHARGTAGAVCVRDVPRSRSVACHTAEHERRFKKIDTPQLVHVGRCCLRLRHCSPPRTTSTQGNHPSLPHSRGMVAIRWLGWASIAFNIAAGGVAARPHGCSDPAASNYDPLSPVTAEAMFNNSGCLYSCKFLCSHFSVDYASALCLIDTGADTNWTHSNSTLYASLGTSLIVQGSVKPRGESPVGRTQLRRRIETTSTGGATVILVQPSAPISRTLLQHTRVCCYSDYNSALACVWTVCRQRHVAMVGLHAKFDSLGNFRDGGAVQVLRSNLTIEHCIFVHNKADGGGAVKASGTIRIFNTLFQNNTVSQTLATCTANACTRTSS